VLESESKDGLIADSYLNANKHLFDISARLSSQRAREAYQRLSLLDKYRVMDQMFQPNDYRARF